MNLNGSIGKTAVIGSAAAALALMTAVAGAQDAGDIMIGTAAFPESIAATPEGGFITGSVASGNISRWSPGDDAASVWATVEGISLGVFADADTAYVCVNSPSFGDGTLVTLDLSSGDQTGAYPLPGGGLCNDIAVGPDGTAFITDTGSFSGRPGAVFALVPVNEDGDLGLQSVVASMAMGGADGLAFLGNTLVVNDVGTGALFAIELDGATMVSFTTLTTSRALEGPDGMRTAADGTGIWVAENDAGRVSFISLDGDNANIETIVEADWASATAVAETGGVLYAIDTNFPALGGDDMATTVFYAYAIDVNM